MKTVKPSGYWRAGDIIRSATGEPYEVTVESSLDVRFTVEGGWEQRENDGPWKPYGEFDDE